MIISVLPLPQKWSRSKCKQAQNVNNRLTKLYIMFITDFCWVWIENVRFQGRYLLLMEQRDDQATLHTIQDETYLRQRFMISKCNIIVILSFTTYHNDSSPFWRQPRTNLLTTSVKFKWEVVKTLIRSELQQNCLSVCSLSKFY